MPACGPLASIKLLVEKTNWQIEPALQLRGLLSIENKPLAPLRGLALPLIVTLNLLQAAKQLGVFFSSPQAVVSLKVTTRPPLANALLALVIIAGKPGSAGSVGSPVTGSISAIFSTLKLVSKLTVSAALLKKALITTFLIAPASKFLGIVEIILKELESGGGIDPQGVVIGTQTSQQQC